MNKLLFGLLSVLLLFACAAEEKEANPAESETKTYPVVPEAVKPEKTKLIANIDYVRLRSEPGTDSETVAMLSEGDVMYDLGEMSDFTTQVELRGVKYNEPWLKVETSDGQVGWIYGGAVYFDLDSSSKATDLLVRKRLVSFYGKEETDRILSYRDDYRKALTDKAFTSVLRSGVALTEVLNEKNENILPEPAALDTRKAPDLRWLEQSLPGYTLGSAAEGTRYWFFKNLKALAEKAGQTSGRADDDYIDLCLQMFPVDSIEYFYPVWFMQTWDYGGHSLLGEGHHLAILQKANELMAKHPGFFDEEAEKIKNDIIHDATASPGGYWYKKEKILSEIQGILKAELGILTNKDIIALQAQEKRLENPSENNIKVGIRSGM